MKNTLITTSLVILGAAATFQSCKPNKHISDYVVNNKIEKHVTNVADTTYLTRLYKVTDKASASYLEVSKYKDKSGEHIVFASDIYSPCSAGRDVYKNVHYHIMTIERAKQVRDYTQSVENWEKFVPIEGGKPKMEQTEINYQIDEGVFLSFVVSYQYEVVAKEDGGQQGKINAFIDEMDVWIKGRKHRVHIDSFVKSLQGLGQ